jgi:putative acetyltransferase
LLTVIQAETPQQIATARELMMEYSAALGIDLCFQNFDEEMGTLPGKYAPPEGRILLAYWGGQPAGVVALRPVAEPRTCEMKRLFVRTAFRGKSVGRALAEGVIAAARDCGYSRMRLDTIQGKMDSAIRLYRELGFREVPPYYPSPVRETLFMELSMLERAGS